jgi:hypothetical protein
VAFITLTSDYGTNSPYAAAVKGAIYAQLPNATIIDISHNVSPFNLLQASFLLKQVVWHYPIQSIHLICIDANLSNHKQCLIAYADGQYFIGADNGIFSILFPNHQVQFYAVKETLIQTNDLFPEKNLFAYLAIQLVNNIPISDLAIETTPRTIKQSLMPVIEENLIRGTIVFVDGYDNAITNISEQIFYEKLKAKKGFVIYFKRKLQIAYISKNYSDVIEGNEVALFNESGFLEIAMNAGKASQLLGLQLGAHINIEFYD